MPTFPKYEGSTNVAAPNTPLNPTESIASKQLGELGKGVEQVGLTTSAVGLKLKNVRDTADAAMAYQTATTETEQFMESLKGLNAQDARKKYDKFIADNQARWYKGLSPEAAYKFQYDFFPKQLEGAAHAAGIGFRYETDKAGAAMTQAALNWQKRINDRKVYGDPSLDPEFIKMKAEMDVYIANGVYTQKEGAAWVKGVLHDGAYDQAYREAHAAPESFRAEYRKYQSEKGPNRAPHSFDYISEKELAILDGEAKQQMWSDKEHKHAEEQWKQQEMDKADIEKREKTEIEMGMLADKKLLTMGKVEEYGKMRLTTGERTEWWRARVRGDLIEGGNPNPEKMYEYTRKVTQAMVGTQSQAELQALMNDLDREALAKNLPRKQTEIWRGEIAARMRAEDTPERRRGTEAKSLLHKMLAPTDGKFSQTGKERDVEVEWLKRLADNEKKQGTPDYVDPVDFIYGNQDKIRANAGQGGPAVNQARVETGVGVAPKEPGAPDEGVYKKLDELEKVYRDPKSTKQQREEAARKILEIQNRVVKPSKANAEAKRAQEEYNKQRREQREQGKLSIPAPPTQPKTLAP